MNPCIGLPSGLLTRFCHNSNNFILLILCNQTKFGEVHNAWSSSGGSFPLSPVNLLPLMSKYLPQHPIVKQPRYCSSITMWYQVSHIHKTAGKINSSACFIFIFLVNKPKYSELNGNKHFPSSICPEFLHEYISDLFVSFPNIDSGQTHLLDSAPGQSWKYLCTELNRNIWSWARICTSYQNSKLLLVAVLLMKSKG